MNERELYNIRVSFDEEMKRVAQSRDHTPRDYVKAYLDLVMLFCSDSKDKRLISGLLDQF